MKYKSSHEALVKQGMDDNVFGPQYMNTYTLTIGDGSSYNSTTGGLTLEEVLGHIQDNVSKFPFNTFIVEEEGRTMTDQIPLEPEAY